MPSKSAKQARTMREPRTFGFARNGIPLAAAKEFAAADKKKKK